jgi:integrase
MRSSCRVSDRQRDPSDRTSSRAQSDQLPAQAVLRSGAFSGDLALADHSARALVVRYQRATPYLWSSNDICQLLDASRMLRPPLKAASYEALFGLLAVTGTRVGEAVALERDHVDLDNAVITISEQIAKRARARLVPLHPTTADALKRYAGTRERLCPKPGSTRFFLSASGTQLDRHQVSKTPAHAHHHARAADRDRSPACSPSQTQFCCPHTDRVAAIRCRHR